MDEKKEIKQVVWKWLSASYTAVADFPDGKSMEFSLKQFCNELPNTVCALIYYGFKQWISSNYAKMKKPEDKRTSAKADYDSLREHGLKFAGEGQIVLANKPEGKGNAGAKAQLAEMKSMTQLMAKKLRGEVLTEEEDKFIIECLERLK